MFETLLKNKSDTRVFTKVPFLKCVFFQFLFSFNFSLLLCIIEYKQKLVRIRYDLIETIGCSLICLNSKIFLTETFCLQTLIMDESRLAEMRWSVRRTTLIASVLLVTLNTVGQQLASDAAYLATLKEVLYILLDGVPEG